MAKASTGDAAIGARTASSDGPDAENSMGRPDDIGTSTMLRCDGTAEVAKRDGSRGECGSGEGEMGIGFFLRSRPQGDKVVRGGACGGREGHVARGVRQERPLGGGTIVTEAPSERASGAVGLSGSRL
jgi:hypothetical protein